MAGALSSGQDRQRRDRATMAHGPRAVVGLAVVALVTGCSSAGVVPIDNDTSMVAKRSAQTGLGRQ
jgi:hypothetical protein